MKVRPILFNTEMVRAVLDGRKMVTRRVADIDTNILCNDGTNGHIFVSDNFTGGTPTGFVCRKCGFGVAPPHSRVPCGTSLFRPHFWPGDILYVRETWRIRNIWGDFARGDRTAEIEFKAAGPLSKISGITEEFEEKWRPGTGWHPSIFMQKEAARVFLRVTHVRLERLQAITADECPMEGVWPLYAGLVGEREAFYKGAFAKLWDSTVKQADLDTYGWKANPWVWVIRFERCEKPKEG